MYEDGPHYQVKVGHTFNYLFYQKLTGSRVLSLTTSFTFSLFPSTGALSERLDSFIYAGIKVNPGGSTVNP